MDSQSQREDGADLCAKAQARRRPFEGRQMSLRTAALGLVVALPLGLLCIAALEYSHLLFHGTISAPWMVNDTLMADNSAGTAEDGPGVSLNLGAPVTNG